MKIEDHINREELAERLDHDMNLYRELVELFLNDSVKLLERINEAIINNDAQGLQKAAHTLKGSVSNFSAFRAREIALQLEYLGRDKNLNESSRIFQILDDEITNVKEAMRFLSTQESL